MTENAAPQKKPHSKPPVPTIFEQKKPAAKAPTPTANNAIGSIAGCGMPTLDTISAIRSKRQAHTTAPKKTLATAGFMMRFASVFSATWPR